MTMMNGRIEFFVCAGEWNGIRLETENKRDTICSCDAKKKGGELEMELYGSGLVARFSRSVCPVNGIITDMDDFIRTK